ncbi:hypothetical protein [Streptomyces sp. TRM68367]|uniref:hypothetical protein n=1 Tax=Streptomyces sp. TRM68367 TaxID=2758415 RepID=UPI00165C6316|nr:hypothetical protein [Streptomyces sp. TRM68367]MBC9725008.1 hypothetical protein [Streptomyces sp. TRM68367]
MSRRVLMPLRAWSGALLTCAVLLCLAGLARPAMAMPSSMAAMERAAPAAASGLTHVETGAQAAAPAMATDAAGDSVHCPMAEKQCTAPKATLGHDVQPGPVLTGLPTVTSCSHAAVTAQPHAPPPAMPPPDLHRLCVSRT